jgi:hypothetical protein
MTASETDEVEVDYIRGSINPDEDSPKTQKKKKESDEDLEQSVWESSAEQYADQPPLETRLSPSSANYCAKVFEHFIASSTATLMEKDTVRKRVDELLQSALAATDGDRIFDKLQDAGAEVNALYPTVLRGPVFIHHLPGVAEHQDTFIRTRRGRIRVKKAIRDQIKDSVQKIAGLTPTEREDRIRELTNLAREQILDMKTTGRELPLEEVEMLTVTERHHIEIHRRRE